jgi:hypothetical protein
VEIGESVTLRVSAIANGFLVTEERSDEKYSAARTQPLFYPTLKGVEAELVFRFRSAQQLGLKEVDF